MQYRIQFTIPDQDKNRGMSPADWVSCVLEDLGRQIRASQVLTHKVLRPDQEPQCADRIGLAQLLSTDGGNDGQ